jgi:hypothetical protein
MLALHSILQEQFEEYLWNKAISIDKNSFKTICNLGYLLNVIVKQTLGRIVSSNYR